MAQSLFEQAKQLMEAGNYPEACPKLAESQRLDPGGGTLLNLALCREKEGKVASAWSGFKEALSVARHEGRADRMRAAEERIAALEPQLPWLTLQVTDPVADQQITLDGATLGRAAWGVAVAIDPGAHELTATAPGHTAWTTSITLACGDACGPRQKCSAGGCVCSSAGETLCGDACVDLQKNFGNCGECDNTCRAEQACTDGQCQCAGGQADCGDACVDLNLDDTNCGACGNACEPIEVCIPSQGAVVASCRGIVYDFESGLQDWEPDMLRDNVDAIESSQEESLSGARSLKVTTSLDAETDPQAEAATAYVSIAAPPGLAPGMVLRFSVWAPSGTWAGSVVQYGTEWEGWDQPTRQQEIWDGWTTWTHTVPEEAEPIQAIGVAVGAFEGTTFQGSFYVDAVAW